MSEVLPFTLSFLKLHPQSAANVLERLPPKNTVAFLDEIPVELAARTLEVLSPQYAAQCFLNISPERCGELMQEMKATSGISLLRFIPNSVTQTILKNLLPEKKQILKKRLSYPQDLVGAWMDSKIPAVSESTIVGEIRKSFRLSKAAIDYAPCVTTNDGFVAGLLSLAKLITAKDSIRVDKILDLDFKTISDRATIKSVSSSPYWDRFDALPVVDQKGKFVGMLTLKTLNRALAIVRGNQNEDQMDSVLMDGVNAYVSTLEWLVQSAIGSPKDSIPDSKVLKDDK